MEFAITIFVSVSANSLINCLQTPHGKVSLLSPLIIIYENSLSPLLIAEAKADLSAQIVGE